MATDRFLIGSFDKDSGLQTNVEAFLIPDTAFAQLTNAYVWRGRVRKRFGSTWLGNDQLSSRLRVKIGTTVPGAAVQTFMVPMNTAIPSAPIITPALGQMFSIGTDVFTVKVLGSPAPTGNTGSTTATFNATTGAFTVTPVIFTVAQDVYYYPALPVMGLQTFEGAAINYEPVIGFDTKFAYQYTGGGWERLNTELVPGQATWNGTNAEFFWTCTWLGTDAYTKLFFVTNFNELEPFSMRYYDNTMWRRFMPAIASETYMFGARILVPFKNRLLAFNTWEGPTLPSFNYPNRCRYSQIGNTIPLAPTAYAATTVAGAANGTIAGGAAAAKPGQMFTIGNETFMITPTVLAGVGPTAMPSTTGVATIHTFDPTNGNYNFTTAAPNSVVYFYAGGTTAIVNTEWRQDVPGHGNAIDCPTTEQIISVEFIKDRLIVFFERSTWELVYLGNQAYPFGWQQINTELGAESTFSTVPFDKVAISVGNVGIMACNGANMERIDDSIPSTVFAIHNANDGIERVYGVRDYTNEMIYWTMPDNTRDSAHVYPNRILVFNYKTGTWAIFIDSITCFGYYYNFTGITWDSTTITWDSLVTWDSGSLDAQAKHVIAGNQQGYTFMINPDEPTNAQVLQITNLAAGFYDVTLTSYDHNLQAGEYIYLDNLVGSVLSNISLLNGKIFYIESTTQHTITIDTSTLGTSIAGVYEGNGTISRVSAIDIKTKEFNFYMDKGRNACISKVDFLVERTDNGQIDIDYYVSSNSDSISSFSDPAVLVSDGSLETYPYIGITAERHATRLWHPMYIIAEGQCIQLHFYMDYPNMISNLVRKSQFVLHAMVFHAMPSSINLR